MRHRTIATCGTHIAPAPEDPDIDIEDRDEALQPDLTEEQQNRKNFGDAFLDEAVQPRVEAISERAVLASLLFGLLVRGLFTIHVADPLGLHDQPVYTDIPVSQAAIPDLSCRNLFLQLVRGLPGNGANTRPNAAVAAVLAAHPDLRARLAAIPRHPSDTNMVDHVGKQLETAFSNMLTLLFAGRLKKSVSLAGAKVLVSTEEHQRRFGLRGLVGGHLPAWSKRQCTYVRRMVCGLDVSWLVGEGGVVPTAAMQAEVALQRGLLGLEEGEEVDDDWVEDPTNRVSMPHVSMQVAAASVQRSKAFYDRDVSAALNIRRCAVGPGPRPTELCYWEGRPAMPKPGRQGQEVTPAIGPANVRRSGARISVKLATKF
ncbi:hypothetical protein QJQ45_008023 [Haematococcus lacustris]|nr:hypothetical protein QJQ45_008023 [Haematococcus lacustris]